MKPAKRPCVDSPNVVSVDNGSTAVGEEAAAVVALSPWGEAPTAAVVGRLNGRSRPMMIAAVRPVAGMPRVAVVLSLPPMGDRRP